MGAELKKGVYNIVFGFAGQIITIALGIIIPRLFIVNLGSAANGLLASIGQVLAYLTLLEAGLGGASIQALYRPLAHKDRDSINGILAATEIYYKKTGRLYLLFVVLIAFLYPLIIDSFSYTTTCAIVLLSGIPGVLNYYYQGKFRVLLTAEGKSYLITNIATGISILTSITKIILLSLGYGLIAIQVSYCILALIPILIYHLLFKKSYQWVNFKSPPDYKSLTKKNSVFIQQLCSLITLNTPVILLTLFCDLKVVSVFMIYNMIFDIIAFSTQLASSSITYIFGKTYHTDTKLFNVLFELYENIFFAGSISMYTTAYLLILPFVALYTNGVSDTDYLLVHLPLLFVIFKALAVFRTPTNHIINTTGHFKETQFSAIGESILCVIVSLPATLAWGIYGVLFGNIISSIYRAGALIAYANRYILKRPISRTLISCSAHSALSAIVIFMFPSYIQTDINSYVNFFLRALIVTPCIVLLFTLLAISLDFRQAKSLRNILRLYTSRKEHNKNQNL